MIEEFPDRRFITFDVNEIHLIDFNEVFETNENTLRLSTNKLKSFVKYDLPTPSFVNNLISKSQEYTYDEFDILLKTNEWIGLPNPIP